MVRSCVSVVGLVGRKTKTPGRVADRGFRGALAATLLEWAASRLGTRLTVARLAERAGLSSRTLARQFTEQLGTSPGQWLLGRRLDAARVLLEQTDLPVEAIATRVGLASAVNLRRHFRAHLGTTPGSYRRTFSETR